MQFAAQRVIGEVLASAVVQMFLEQLDGPRRGVIVEVLRRMLEKLE